MPSSPARRAGQAPARRADRRRQVRRDVSGPDPEDTGRASRRHRRSLAGERAREPRARRLEAGAARGAVARRRARARSHARRRGLGGARRASRDRDRRRGHRQPDRRGHARARGVPAWQARRDGHGRGRRVLRPAARAQGARGGRRLQPRVRRPAGADLRSRRLGARRRVRRRRGGARPQVAAALRAVDARDRVAVLRAHARAGARRRAQPEDVQFVPRRLEARDREHRGVQCDRTDAGAVGAGVSAVEHRRSARSDAAAGGRRPAPPQRARWRWCPRSSRTAG